MLHSQFERDGAMKTPSRGVKTQTLTAKPDDLSESHNTHLSSPNPSNHHSVLLMMCPAMVVATDSHITRATALID